MDFEILATVLFGGAVLHTFACSRLRRIASLPPLFSEVELVFGLWAILFLATLVTFEGLRKTLEFVSSLHFTEPLFVFVIMTVASSRPILTCAQRLISGASRLIPLSRSRSLYWAMMTLGPLLGSFITEPAAMTVTALLLKERYFDRGRSEAFLYTSLAVLFVNISIGGVLTPFAAPPVLMVASRWNWDLNFMLGHFGWKAVLACVLNASLATWLFRAELQACVEPPVPQQESTPLPHWISGIYLLILFGIIFGEGQIWIFLSLLGVFLIVFKLTARFAHGPLRIRESAAVGFFLAGLVVLGAPQAWWIRPLIQQLSAGSLFLGTTLLTAITDNAALTHLGSHAGDLSLAVQYALVSGAVAGGGLTVIANAPNPSGYSILQDRFGPAGIQPLKLFLAAITPTLIAMACFWWT